MAKNRYYCQLTFTALSAIKKIAVNTRFLIKNKLEGIGLFTAESLKIITRAHPDVEFYFLFDRPYDEEFIFAPNVKPVVLFPPARHPFLWYWWFEISVSKWLRKNRPDLFLSTDGYACLSTSVKQVTVMHDLAFEHFKGQVGGLTGMYYRYFMPRFAQKVNRIATVSEFSKSDIIKQYNIAADKIDVVYNGVKDVYRILSKEEKQQTRGKFTGGKEYFIYVGSIHPRKNVANLLKAFNQFKTDTGCDMQLLLAGRKAWDFAEVDQFYVGMEFKADVKFLGHVPPDELGALVGAAYAMVYVSLFEGFGIPLIEAMGCLVPVITSNVTSMPEVAGNAGLLVDPYSVDSIAAAMKKLVSEAGLREELIARGKMQAQKFSWNLTAEKLWNCCLKAGF
jgi:glycosyltransferase involved in cell wall biosynthesis